MGGEAFIPKMNGQAGQFTKIGDEGMDLLSLRAEVAVQGQGIADHDCGYCVAATETRDRTQILARISAALQGQYGLRGVPEFVGNSNTDALRPDIESKIAGRESWIVRGRLGH